MQSTETNWLHLAQGIEIPRYHVIVPWLATEAELFKLVPSSEFLISEGGGWPMLRFKFLGFSALWGFNFVSSPSGQLTELQFRNDHPHSPKRTYHRSIPKLQRSLGKPNVVDHGLTGQQTWHLGSVRVENHIVRGSRLPSMQAAPVHTLSIFHHASDT